MASMQILDIDLLIMIDCQEYTLNIMMKMSY